MPGFRQVEISKWFGDIDNVTYFKHPASPSVDIFRVSNDPNEGSVLNMVPFLTSLLVGV